MFETFRSNKDILDTLQIVGLTKENVNTELRKEIKLPVMDEVSSNLERQ